jgi:hypothetical protein
MREHSRRLLAKSSRSPNAPEAWETLGGHILDVVAVAEILVSSWGTRILESVGLQPSLRDPLNRPGFSRDSVT